MFYMSVSLIQSMPMTSHRDLFPMVASLKKLSLSPTSQENHHHTNHHVHHQPNPQGDDMITDKDEPTSKAQDGGVEVR